MVKDIYYRVKVRKAWFRGKGCFPRSLSQYERELMYSEDVNMPLCAGNMIYEMMQLLESGVEWQKQSSLMAAYRPLVYRLSYTLCSLRRNDLKCVYIEGQKSDVMWTLSFITQVFNDEAMYCSTVPIAAEEEEVTFQVKNGEYISGDARKKNGKMPDIWSIKDTSLETFDPYFEPQSGDSFVLPDGRTAVYIRMDERYYMAKTKGKNIDEAVRHNISASFIKDFENIVRTQTKANYDTYQMRYQALMNKAHEIENLMEGFEVSVYDILPVAERGLPLASSETISRTNKADKNSLKYAYDTIRNGKPEGDELAEIGKNIVNSLAVRQKGYETEYRTYIASGTDENLAKEIFNQSITEMYIDFARLDYLRALRFRANVYRDLCNVPAHSGSAITVWEKKRIRLFGKGYLDFLSRMLKKEDKQKIVWQVARRLLDTRYIKADKNK